MIGLFLGVVNFVSGKIIRKFAAYERHHSRTGYYLSCAEKLSLVNYVNGGLLIFIINYEFRTIGTSGGLIYDIMYISIMNIVVTNGLNFFNPWWCNRLRHQKNLRAIAEKDPNKQTISFLWARDAM